MLLTAHSFADLLNRYKYLYLVARRDRWLVGEVAELQRQLELREHELRRSYTDLQYLQNERAAEHAQLGDMAQQRSTTLSSLRSHERTTVERIGRAAARRAAPHQPDGHAGGAAPRGGAARARPRRRGRARPQLRRRRRPLPPRRPRRAAAPRPAATMTTADVGNLSWPVAGPLVYRFGRAVQSNGTAIRYNGAGDRRGGGDAGARGGGRQGGDGGALRRVRPHRGGEPRRRLLLALPVPQGDLRCSRAPRSRRARSIGTVGGEGTPEGSHVEFQIRTPGGEAVDPLTWLRGR